MYSFLQLVYNNKLRIRTAKKSEREEGAGGESQIKKYIKKHVIK